MFGRERLTPFGAALGLWRARYADARVIFLAGSVMRGEVRALALVEEMLAPFGGMLFDGFRIDAHLREKMYEQ